MNKIKKKSKYNNVHTSLCAELKAPSYFKEYADLYAYHKALSGDINEHFNFNEPTISYLFRERHPALDGLSYGSKLYKKLNSLKKLSQINIVVEVGGGLGFLAREFILEDKKNRKGKSALNYFFCDLAFEFIRNQERLNKKLKINSCQANAESLPFRNESVDLIISNENLADFSQIKLNKEKVLYFLNDKLNDISNEDAVVKKSINYIKSYSIKVDDAMPEFIFNIGAMDFISEIKRVLKIGGMAFISEYGITKYYPTAVHLNGHIEYSIQFSHLLKAAKALGLQAKLFPLTKFFEFDKNVSVIDYNSLKFLSSISKKLGIKLPFLAYTQDMLINRFPELKNELKNTKFIKIKHQSVCHTLDAFYVLLLSKTSQLKNSLGKNENS